MAIQNWSVNVNTKILRDGSSWDNPTQFIEDETRSGKRKRRLYATKSPRAFSVQMRFTESEYTNFVEWYESTIKYGLLPFYFPQIDKSGIKSNKVYRFAKDGAPSYSNTSGKYIDCSMKWEEQ